MKLWKKINKGLILTIIVVVILIIYFEQVEKQRELDKTDIKSACNEYISLIDNLIVLPEEAQEPKKEDVENELKKVMIDNVDAIEIQSQYILDVIEQSNSNKIITNCKKNISEITKYEFDGDQVVVSFSSILNTTYKIKNTLTNELEEKQNVQSMYGEEITLQKIEDEWKIVYSNLDYYQASYDMYVY